MKVVAILAFAVVAYYAFTAIGGMILWLVGGFVDNFLLFFIGIGAFVWAFSNK